MSNRNCAKFSQMSCIVVLLLCTFGYGSPVNGLAADGRVVGGSDAKANAAPYIVSIQQNGVHYCAGSILNTNWVLTAAHCLSSKQQVLSSTMMAGSNNVAGTASTTQRRSITYYIVNELYTGGTSPYDIGMIYTPTAFTWTTAVTIVNLPVSKAIPTGNAVLFGWGSTSTTSVPSYPTNLQEATVPIISISSCESALGAQGENVHDTNFCTGPLTGGVGICTSDSGGPLVQTASGKTTIVGVVSWGKLPCGQVNSPSVFVQVSSFISWITTNQKVKTI